MAAPRSGSNQAIGAIAWRQGDLTAMRNTASGGKICSVAEMVFSGASDSGNHGSGHAHDGPSIGEPGLADKVSRTVTIDMRDNMRFVPATLRVKQGETLRLLVRNTGAVPHELRHHGVDPSLAVPMYREALQVLLQALTQPSVDFQGQYYTYKDVPMVLAPVQRPHPPLWYGVSAADAAVWPAQNAVNIVCNGPVGRVAEIAARYRAEWASQGKPASALPCIGLSRAVVIGETDEEALEQARVGWKRYSESFYVLWKRHGSMPQYARTPEDFAEMIEAGTGFAGTVSTVRDALVKQARETSVNYVVSRFAFGDMSQAQALRSATLFATEIMPALREQEDQRHAA
jgi:hypothetical protein